LTYESSGGLVVLSSLATMDDVLDVFKPELLQTDDILTVALVTFERTIESHDIYPILANSLERPHSLPFILSREVLIFSESIVPD
jgi:hypothetical protein